MEANPQACPLEGGSPRRAPRRNGFGRIDALLVRVLPLDSRCLARREHVIVRFRLHQATCPLRKGLEGWLVQGNQTPRTRLRLSPPDRNRPLLKVNLTPSQCADFVLAESRIQRESDDGLE